MFSVSVTMHQYTWEKLALAITNHGLGGFYNISKWVSLFTEPQSLQTAVEKTCINNDSPNQHPDRINSAACFHHSLAEISLIGWNPLSCARPHQASGIHTHSTNCQLLYEHNIQLTELSLSYLVTVSLINCTRVVLILDTHHVNYVFQSHGNH